MQFKFTKFITDDRYNKTQKIISFAVISAMLFMMSVRVPLEKYLIETSYASDDTFYKVVSILVNEDIYPQIGDKVKRYAKDISGAMENTKTVIVPIPSDAKSEKIASINEKFYFEGLPDKSFKSSLVGTVLVGDIKLPVVYLNGNSEKTVLPYADFKDKGFIFNNTAGKYIYNASNLGDIKPEVWHGIISPNSGSSETNIQQIKDFFDKDHDFYTFNGNFEAADLKSNEPYVFYFDSLREQESIIYEKYKGYEARQKNLEDLMYRRYTGELAEKLKEIYSATSEQEIKDLLEKLSGKEVTKDVVQMPNTDFLGDVNARYMISSMIKQYPEIFNDSGIGEMRNNVANAGRYNASLKHINVDFVLSFVGKLDKLSEVILKEVATDLEAEVDKAVKNSLSKKIEIPTKIKKEIISYKMVGSGGGAPGAPVVATPEEVAKETNIYTNILYGKKAETIEETKECTIYRGSMENSGKLVEANRGYNVQLIQDDIELLKKESAERCLKDPPEINARFGGTTPINIDQESFSSGDIKLKVYDVKSSLLPLFSIEGSKQSKESAKVPSPKNCLENNFLWTYEAKTEKDGPGKPPRNVPLNQDFSEAENWDCTFPYTPKGPAEYQSATYESVLAKAEGQCDIEVKLDGVTIVALNPCSIPIGGIGEVTTREIEYYDFKSINSEMEHKSPTDEELKAQISNIVSPDLPVDKDRYIDFIGAGGYQKIKYPYPFRIGVGKDELLTMKNIEKAVKAELAGASAGAGVDLLNFVRNKANNTFKTGTTTKDISYYDTFLFAVYWNNLKSATAKYNYVFRRYLNDVVINDDKGGRNGEELSLANSIIDENSQVEKKVPYPGIKRFYESAHLSAPGTADKMFISVDPEVKGVSPIGDIEAANSGLDNQMASAAAGQDDSGGGSTKCSPPEGVPIREWLPAVFCRLAEVMDTAGAIMESDCCGPSVFGEDTEDLGFDEAEKIAKYDQTLGGRIPEGTCGQDANDNGIKDCIEKSDEIYIAGDETGLYNSVIEYKVANKFKGVSNVNDNKTSISLEIQKIEVSKDETKPLSDTNKKLVYKKGDDEKIISTYVTLPKPLVVKDGRTKINLITQNSEAYVYLKAKATLYADAGKADVINYSDEKRLAISGTKLRLYSQKISSIEGLVLSSTSDKALVSDKKNLFLYDKNEYRVNDNRDAINAFSLAEDKLLIGISNIKDTGGEISVNYPIKLNILDKNDEKVNERDIIIKDGQIDTPVSLGSISKAGNYKIQIEDNRGFTEVKDITFAPDKVDHITTVSATSVIEAGGVEISDIVELRDKYNNIAAGTLYDLELEIVGDSITFGDNTKTKKISLIEGLKALDIKSTNISGTSKIIYKIKGTEENGFDITESGKDIRVEKEIKVVEHIDYEIEFPDDMEVGNNTYSYKVKINTADDFNSVGFTYLDKIYGTAPEAFRIENSVGEGTFTTTNIAKEDVVIQFKVAGIKKIIEKRITIKPLKPLKLDFVLEKSRLSADLEDKTKVYVTLRDVFGNAVFTDNRTQVVLSIYPDYQSILKTDVERKVVTNGKAQFELKSTNIPGLAFFRLSTSSNNLSFNSYEYKGKDGETKTILGVGENAGHIKSGYFWTADKIMAGNYNSLYSTLIGANYGDISQQDYLASGIIFDKDNKGLAVTTLLNNPRDYPEVFSVSPYGNLEVSDTPDLTQNIEKDLYYGEGQITKINLFNSGLNKYVGEVVYNFDHATLKECNILDEENCYNLTDKDKKDYIYYKGFNNHKFVRDGDKIVLRNFVDADIVSINGNGQIFDVAKYYTIAISGENDSENLMLDVLDKSGTVLGKIVFSNYGSIKLSRQKEYIRTKGEVIIYLDSTDYGAIKKYYGVDNEDKTGLAVRYNDAFGSDNSTNSFAKLYLNGHEDIENDGTGWKDENKIMLAYANGQSVGEATKNYASFSMVNIGDPVVSLSRFKADSITRVKGKSTSTRSFDSTIGKLLEDNIDIISYDSFDYNHDNYEDIVIFLNSGFIKLFENNKGEYIDRGNIANLEDVSKNSKYGVGDFADDGFGEIVFFNKNFELNILNNDKKDFVRVSLKDDLILNGRLTDFKIFDMDNDGKDDIVTLDDAGEINIFYSKSTQDKPIFVKKFIVDGMGVSINRQETNTGMAVYFDGLKQLEDVKNISSDSMDEATREIKESVSGIVNEVNAGLENTTTATAQVGKTGVDRSTFEKMIFYKFNFTPDSKKPEVDENLTKHEQEKQNVVKVISDMDGITEETAKAYDKSFALIEQGAGSGSVVSYAGETNNLSMTTFVRGEYVDFQGIKITKFSEDNNKSPLQTDDIVKTTIKVKNNNARDIEDFILLEDIPKYLKKTADFKVLVNGQNYKLEKAPEPSRGFDFMIQLGTVKRGEEIIITYETKAKIFESYQLKVGLFEDGETGDDLYGDILCNKVNRSCGESQDMLKSIGARAYERGYSDLSCPAQSNIISMYKTDKDGNNTPDFVDAQIKAAEKLQETGKMEDYEQVKTDYNKDKNQNKIPDFIDEVFKFGKTTDIEEFNVDIDLNEIPDFVDELITAGKVSLNTYDKDANGNNASDFIDALVNNSDIEKLQEDKNKNGTSDFIDALIKAGKAKLTEEQEAGYIESHLEELKGDLDGNGDPSDDGDFSVGQKISDGDKTDIQSNIINNNFRLEKNILNNKDKILSYNSDNKSNKNSSSDIFNLFSVSKVNALDLDYNEDKDNNNVPDFIDNIIAYGAKYKRIKEFNTDANNNEIPDFIDDLINAGELLIEDYKNDSDNNGVSDFLDKLTKLTSDVITDFGKDENNNNISDFTDGLISVGQAYFTEDQVLDFLETNIGDAAQDIKDNGSDGKKDQKYDNVVEEIGDKAKDEAEKLQEDSDDIRDDLQDSVDEAENVRFEADGMTGTIEFGLSEITDEVSDAIDSLIDGFGCGFGGECFSPPINRAPLAPGNDISFLGKPIIDGLHPFEGLPIFAWPTMRKPYVWPPSSLGAGGRFPPNGIGSSIFRLFVTPTLTGTFGIAVCGGFNFINGRIPPPGVSPIVPGGNCIVIAGLGNMCSDDEEDNNEGVDETIGSPDSSCSSYSIFNSGSCSPSIDPSKMVLPHDLVKNIFDTDASDKGNVDYDFYEDFAKNIGTDGYFTGEDLFSGLTTGGGEGMDVGIGFNSEEGGFSITIPDEIKNLRIGSFPAFFMMRFEKQMEEIINKVMDFPKLIIILPDTEGVWDTIKDAYNWENFKNRVGEKEKKGNAQIKDLKKKLAEIDGKISKLEAKLGKKKSSSNSSNKKVNNKKTGENGEEGFELPYEDSRENLSESTSGLFEDIGNFFDGNDDARKMDADKNYDPDAEAATRELIVKLRQERDKIETEIFMREAEFEGVKVGTIKAAYEVLTKLPLLNIEDETIDVILPWISPAMLEEMIIRWKLTIGQRKNEIEDKKRKYTLGAYGCDGLKKKSEIEACSGKINVGIDLITNVEDLIESVDKNIEILESYTEIPEKIYDYMKKKEVRLEQILCNVKTISEMLGGFIKRNGKIFKKWVELYILIKGILKTWQVLIDIFLGYEAECVECKNERFDLITFIFGLILPTPPIIRFPKWPDIILDLHNIKAGLTIVLPDFDFTLEPIVLPDLPELYLPEVPNLNLNLDLEIPEIPLLPELILPELPDIPSLPLIRLPDLPPPPTLPDLFAALKVIADLIRLITKVMCLLKMIPFAPEWRAGDQIAFLTERSGYLAIDFMFDLSFPEFAMSFIDAIEVEAYVNLEYRFDQYVESIRQTFDENVNTFSTDLKTSMEGLFPDLDFSQVLPSEIDLDVKISEDGASVETNAGDAFTPESFEVGEIGEIGADAGFKMKVAEEKAKILKKYTENLLAGLKDSSEKQITTDELRGQLEGLLASPVFNSNPRFAPAVDALKKSLNYDFKKEDKFINSLEKFNSEKYGTLEKIIETEISINKQKAKNIKEKIEKLQKQEKLNKNSGEFISKTEENISTRVSGYNKLLDKYNKDLFEGEGYEDEYSFKRERESMNKTVKKLKEKIDIISDRMENSNGLGENNAENKLQATNYSVNSSASSSAIMSKENLMASISAGATTSSSGSSTTNGTAVAPVKPTSCSASGNGSSTGAYSSNYSGLYVSENGKNYRLFEYLGEVTGDEESKVIDFDNDGDEDLLYQMGTQIFLKENLSVRKKKIKTVSSPKEMNYNSNYFEEGLGYAPAVNGFTEALYTDGQINFYFDAALDESLNNYRIEYYQLIDRFGVEENALTSYGKRGNIIDGISNIDKATLSETKEENYTIRKNLATIDLVGNTAGVYIETPELLNINNDLTSGNEVNVSSSTKLYSGKVDVLLKYKVESEERTIIIPAKSNIEFEYGIEVVDIVRGNLYAEGSEKKKYIGNKVLELSGLPLLPGTVIKSMGNYEKIYNESNYLNIKYYDNYELHLDFRDYAQYNLIDLGDDSDSYFVMLEAKNDLYYARIKNFAYEKESTFSNPVVLAPQKENDKSRPSFSLSNLRVPVYQNFEIDITSAIQDESGIESVSDIYLDIDLDKDSDLDGNNENDKDIILGVNSNENYKIKKEDNKYILTIGDFDTIFEKNIKMYIVDYNDNIGMNIIKVTSYAPTPEIEKTGAGELNGEISEVVSDEPVTLFRYRLGALEKVNPEAINTGEDGEFKYSYNMDKGLEIKIGDKVIAYVNEATGFIEFTSSDYNISDNIKVVMPNDENMNNYPMITVNIDGKQIYESYFVLPDTGEVNLINNLDTGANPGAYLELVDQNNYSTYSILSTAKYNPGAVAIYRNTDDKKEPLFIIYRDGRIERKNALYSINVEELDKHFVYKLSYRNNEVARVLFKVEDNYVINK
ncbi:MAG: taxilin [Candidatus Gracilibacteria bacterium]|nr:taxilin [Candidatus Gracilibacteria bacterium]